jgi:anti-sigma B factor antagonist
MEIKVSKQGAVIVAALSGEIDSSTAPDAQAQLLPLIDGGNKLVLDMQDLTFLSSAGLRIILQLYRQSTSNGGKVALANMQETIRDTMQITGFLAFFQVTESVDDAVKAVNEG